MSDKKEEEERITVRVPKHRKQRAQMAAIMDDQNLSEWLNELIESELEGYDLPDLRGE